MNALRYAADWQREAVSSVLTFNGSDAARRAVGLLNEQLSAQESALAAMLGSQPGRAVSAATDDRVPVRTTRGPLDFGLPESRLPEERAAWYRTLEFTLSGDARFELVNLIDGRRSVSQIRNALSAEFRPIPVPVVARYLEDLAAVGVVEWR
jgi:hypothetical protein